MKTKKNYKLTMLQVVLLIGLVPLLISTAIIFMITNISIKDAMYSDVISKLQTTAITTKMYTLHNGKLDDARAYLDEVNTYGVEMTVINGATRAITTLRNEDGSYNVNTDIDSGILAVLETGKDYSDEDVLIGDKHYCVYYTPMMVEGKYVGAIFAGESVDRINEHCREVSLIIAGVAVLLAVVFVAIILFVARIMCKPLALVAKQLDSMSQGDLTCSDKIPSILRETVTIINAQTLLRTTLLDIVTSLQFSTDKLSETNSEFTEGFGKMSTAVRDVNTAVEEIALGASSQAQDTTDAAAQAAHMDCVSDAIMDDMQNLDKAVNGMNTGISDMSGQVSVLRESIANTAEQSEAVTACALHTNDTVLAIKKVVEAIDDIASQTNILSLNASIEAARAGEAGRGFAVVADSIRSLAQQTADFAKQIAENVTVLIADSNSTVESMKRMTTATETQMQVISITEEKFVSLSEDVNVVSETAKEVSEACKDLHTAIGNISEISQQLSAVSQENAASTQETSATMQDLEGVITRCMADVETLSQLSMELSSISKRFTV